MNDKEAFRQALTALNLRGLTVADERDFYKLWQYARNTKGDTMNDQDRQAFEDYSCSIGADEDFFVLRKDGQYANLRIQWNWEVWLAALAHRDAQHAEVMREVRDTLTCVQEVVDTYQQYRDESGKGISLVDPLALARLDAAAARLREKVGEKP